MAAPIASRSSVPAHTQVVARAIAAAEPVGGTRFELIPVSGGETADALLIHMPELGVMFVGDFIMPYLDAPFVEEGTSTGSSTRSTRSRSEGRVSCSTGTSH